MGVFIGERRSILDPDDSKKQLQTIGESSRARIACKICEV